MAKRISGTAFLAEGPPLVPRLEDWCGHQEDKISKARNYSDDMERSPAIAQLLPMAGSVSPVHVAICFTIGTSICTVTMRAMTYKEILPNSDRRSLVVG